MDAIYKACLLRFRPILMTTMAALFGALPLALGTGVGSELRRPLGITIIGGLIVSQMLTLFTTPIVYIYMDRLQTWLQGKRKHGHALPAPRRTDCRRTRFRTPIFDWFFTRAAERARAPSTLYELPIRYPVRKTSTPPTIT